MPDPNDPTRVSTTTTSYPSYPNDPPVGTSSIAPDPDAPRVVTTTTTTPGEPPVVTQTYTPPPPPPERVDTTERRGGPGWLLPLLLLLGLGLLAWYFLSRRDRDTTELPPMDAPRAEVPAEPATPVGPDPMREREPVAAAAPARKPPAPAGRTDREPEAIARVRPDYPREALRDGEEGTVVVRAMVGIDGLPSEADIARSSRSRLLDRAAVDAVRKWRFSPAMRDGRKVAAAVEVPVDFIASEYR